MQTIPECGRCQRSRTSWKPPTVLQCAARTAPDRRPTARPDEADGFLVNSARGDIIDQGALIRCPAAEGYRGRRARRVRDRSPTYPPRCAGSTTSSSCPIWAVRPWRPAPQWECWCWRTCRRSWTAASPVPGGLNQVEREAPQRADRARSCCGPVRHRGRGSRPGQPDRRRPARAPAGPHRGGGSGQASPGWLRSSRRPGQVISPWIGSHRTRYSVACRRVDLVESAHPVPDASSERAARRVLGLVRHLHSDDLVLALVSGGGSRRCSRCPRRESGWQTSSV